MKFIGKLLGFLLVAAALVVLGVFVWPLIRPDTIKGKAPETFSGSRSLGVSAEAANVPPPVADAGAAPAHAPDAAAEPAGPLCDRLFDAGSARALAMPAGETLRQGPPARGASWTWVSLWAAWCKPCKAEMPMLSEWARSLRARGAALKVLFLSVDDDERQLRKYLAAEGAGLRDEIVWIKDDATRARFYGAIGTENPPTLPVQVLLDPQGRLRCVRVGSIGQRELDEATRTFKW